jgi:hypothetical protein
MAHGRRKKKKRKAKLAADLPQCFKCGQRISSDPAVFCICGSATHQACKPNSGSCPNAPCGKQNEGPNAVFWALSSLVIFLFCVAIGGSVGLVLSVVSLGFAFNAIRLTKADEGAFVVAAVLPIMLAVALVGFVVLVMCFGSY